MSELETYSQFSKRRQEEHDAFSKENIFYAFTNSQLDEALAERNIRPEVAAVVLDKIPCGGFILRDKKDEYLLLLERFAKELETRLEDQEFMLDALVYELSNHEYGYTLDPTDALESLGLRRDQVKDSVLREACNKSLELSE